MAIQYPDLERCVRCGRETLEINMVLGYCKWCDKTADIDRWEDEDISDYDDYDGGDE